MNLSEDRMRSVHKSHDENVQLSMSTPIKSNDENVQKTNVQDKNVQDENVQLDKIRGMSNRNFVLAKKFVFCFMTNFLTWRFFFDDELSLMTNFLL